MEQQYTYDKILVTLASVPFATREALTEFVLDELSVIEIDHLLGDLLADNKIKHRTKYGYELLMLFNKWQYRGPDVTSAFVAAFWVIAHIGADNVKSIAQGQGPTRLWFITEEDQVCDITVANNKLELDAAYKIRNEINNPIEYPIGFEDPDLAISAAALEELPHFTKPEVMEKVMSGLDLSQIPEQEKDLFLRLFQSYTKMILTKGYDKEANDRYNTLRRLDQEAVHILVVYDIEYAFQMKQQIKDQKYDELYVIDPKTGAYENYWVTELDQVEEEYRH